jgi:site-specific DNA-methyltransferase (adenine-specific)
VPQPNEAGQLLRGDARELLASLPENHVAACLTDPPYNYEFVGREWNHAEIQRRLERARSDGSTTLVKNLPYGSGLAGGVRNARWYERNRENVLDYEEWTFSWAEPLFRVCKPGAPVAVFSSTRTVAHVQVALERAGFYARDCLVYRRHGGIPKGLNAASKLRALGDPDAELWTGWHSALRGEWEAICLVQKPLVRNYLTTIREHGVGLFKTELEDGSFQSNVLEGFTREADERVAMHCTPKPLALMRKLVEMLVPPSAENVVLDPFAGSGTTLLAAEQLGHRWIGVELVEPYCAVIEQRIRDWRSTQPESLDLWRRHRERELSPSIDQPSFEIETTG